MATFQVRTGKDGALSVRAQIFLRNVRDSGSFPSKGAARAWATRREAEILADARGEIPDKTFGDLLRRYRDEVSPKKKGAKFEIVRIDRILGNTEPALGPLKEPDPIALVPLRDIDSRVVAEWRDRRLAAGLKDPSVRREWNQLSSACGVAVGEWHWLRINPFSKQAGAKRPPNSRHRDVLIQDEDLVALQKVADEYSTANYRRVMRALRFCIETAVRAGEMVFLGDNPDRLSTTRRVAHLPDTKNGNARDVPLSLEAIRLWNEALAEHDPEEGRGVWGHTSATLDTNWRSLRARAGRKHLHFHDSRHTAITRLAKKLQIMDLARMTGHTNLKELMTYYNESAESIAMKL